MKLSTVLIGIVSLACITEPAWTQTMGDEAELERLRVKAEAIASDDPEGAAMNMGRAALMAKRLGLLSRDNHASVRLYQGAESLFRSQEHGYRAMALFRRAGGQLPASSGVCGSLALAQGSVQRALLDLSSESFLFHWSNVQRVGEKLPMIGSLSWRQ